MNWEIKRDAQCTTVILGQEMAIQNAAEFYRELLPLSQEGRPVRVQAEGVKSIHSAILQMLYALSLAVDDFGVNSASNEFQARETRAGLAMRRAGAETMAIRRAA